MPPHEPRDGVKLAVNLGDRRTDEREHRLCKENLINSCQSHPAMAYSPADEHGTPKAPPLVFGTWVETTGQFSGGRVPSGVPSKFVGRRGAGRRNGREKDSDFKGSP